MAKRKRKTKKPPRETSDARSERYEKFLQAQVAEASFEDLEDSWLFTFRGSSKLQEQKRTSVRQGNIE